MTAEELLEMEIWADSLITRGSTRAVKLKEVFELARLGLKYQGLLADRMELVKYCRERGARFVAVKGAE